MKNHDEPIFTITFNRITNDGFIIIYRKSKVKITKSEIKQMLAPGKIDIRKAKLKTKLLIQIFSKVFPEYIFIDGNDVFITAFDVDSSFEKLYQYFIERRKCKRFSVTVTKDFKCSKYFDCLIANNGQKPEWCVAQADKSENSNIVYDNNHEFEPKVLVLEKTDIEPEIYNHYMNIINNLVETEFKNLSTSTTNIINTANMYTAKKRNNNFIIKDFEDDFDEEVLITLYGIKNISEEAYQKIVDSSTKLIHEVLKSACPFVILTDYAKQIGGLGTCKILSKKAKPIKVNARQPYVFTPKVKTCCYEQYKFGEFQKCWVYQTYYKKHGSDDEIEIEVENIA